MKKADKRRIGEARQAENRELSRQTGLKAQAAGRAARLKAKEPEVKVRKFPSKDAPKKFGKITKSFKEVGAAAEKATKALPRQNQFDGPGLAPGS